MGDFGMMGGYGVAWSVLKLVYFILASFIFSLIFWLTHEWLARQKKGKKR